MEALKQSKPEITILKFIACLLIANSHLDSLYPVKQLATGGALGNAIFFYLSGYSLQYGYLNRKTEFSHWFTKRLRRLYPAMLVVALYEFIDKGYWQSFSLPEYLTYFIWPSAAWFVGAITLFYIIYYQIMQHNNQRIYVYAIIIAATIYVIWYITFVDLKYYSIEGPSYFKWCFYFIVMLVGGCSALWTNSHHKMIIKYLLLILVPVYFGFGYLLTKKYYLQYQFAMHVVTVIAVPILFATVANSRRIRAWYENSKLINWVISFIAGLTLEIYLIQYQVYSNPWIQARQFPLNVLLFILLTVILAYVLSSVIRIIVNTVRNKLEVIYASR